MADNKKSFLLYKSHINLIKSIDILDVGLVFLNIFKYVNGEDIDVMYDEKTLFVYKQIISDIEYEWSKLNPKTKKYHWNYKGGITPINKSIRNSFQSKHWRNEVFIRDSYTCQNCKKIGGFLHSHHIKHFSKYPDLRFDINNGITLCKQCHILEHKKFNNNVG